MTRRTDYHRAPQADLMLPEALVARAMRHVRFDPSGCWVWTGTKSSGYGRLYVTPSPRVRRSIPAHRFLWERVNGPVPEGKECGHRCPGGARKDCVNPDHIEAITHSENGRDYYAGLCAKGLHDLTDPANVTVWRGGETRCRPCRVAYDRRRHARVAA